MRGSALLCLAAFGFASCSSASEPAIVVTEPVIQARLVAAPEDLPEKRGPITIHAVGDLLAHESVAGSGGLPLDGVTELLSSDQVTVGNLECPASSSGPEPVDDRPTCDPNLLAQLRAAGIDVVSLANDRSVDRGRVGLTDTITAAERANLLVVGAGNNASEAYAAEIIESGGWRIAVIGTTAIGNNFAGPDQAGTAPVERTTAITNAITRVRKDVDLVLVTVHWGRPLDRDPEQRDRQYAETLVDAGADAIFGHGPHRLQSFALVDGIPVFWSLGHFLWPVSDPADADSSIGRIEIEIDGTITVCSVPVTIDDATGPTLDRSETSCGS